MYKPPWIHHNPSLFIRQIIILRNFNIHLTLWHGNSEYPYE